MGLVAIGVLYVRAQGVASRGVIPAARSKFSGRPWNATFTDISTGAGFTHPMVYGGIQRIDYLVESSGGGLAVIDFDKDGWLDLFVVNGTRWKDPPKGAHHLLYRNNKDGTFSEVSEGAGVAKSGWGMGATVGDYDGDGFDDLYVTQWGHDILFHNNRDGTFTDVTDTVGLFHADVRWGAGAAFLDYDHDGDLDLFVSTYLEFDPGTSPKPGTNPNCVWKGMDVACGPRGLAPGHHYLFRNDGGRFTDVSAESGIRGASRTFGMTVIAADLDDDGWPDLYAASDSTPSLYFRNLHNGKFKEEGLERAVAVNEDGREQAGMGIAIGDADNDGRLDLFKTHFAEDTPVLYLNNGRGWFRDATLPSGLGVETRYVGWGASFADFDNDGWADLFWVTGHLYPETRLADFPYRTPALLFRNLGAGKFEQIGAELAGKAIAEPHSSRGSVVFDFDNDGDLDIATWNRNEPVRLLRNDVGKGRHWIQFDAPLHTRVTVMIPGAGKQVQEIVSQSSFYSSPGRVIHFGLGAAAKVDVVVRFPDQTTQTLRGLAADRRYPLKSPAAAQSKKTLMR